jgi:hypothetical protein
MEITGTPTWSIVVPVRPPEVGEYFFGLEALAAMGAGHPQRATPERFDGAEYPDVN